MNSTATQSNSHGDHLAPGEPGAGAPPPPAAVIERNGTDQASRLRALVNALGQYRREPEPQSAPINRAAASPIADPVLAEPVDQPAAPGAAVIAPPVIPHPKPDAQPIGPAVTVTHVNTGFHAPVYTVDYTPPEPSANNPNYLTSTPERVATLITIASGKGGVGKTSLAVNLAVSFAQRHQRVTLLDADLGTANADLLCGLNPAARVEHVLGRSNGQTHRNRTLADIAIDAPGGFKLVPGSVGLGRMADLGEADRRRLVQGLSDLEQSADVVIIDAAAGIGSLVTTFVNAADITLVVATPEPTSIADAYALIKCAITERRGVPPPIALVINEALDQKEAEQVHKRIDAVCRRFLGISIPLAGWIAHDPHVAQAVRARTPFMLRHPHCPAGLAVSRLSGILARHFRLSPAASIAPANEPGALQRLSSWLAHFASRV